MITNTRNGKMYIGQSRCVRSRLRAHFTEKRGGMLHRDIRLLGKKAFRIDILAQGITSKDDLDEAEKRFIREYNSIGKGYNILAGGSGNKYEVYDPLANVDFKMWDQMKNGGTTPLLAWEPGLYWFTCLKGHSEQRFLSKADTCGACCREYSDFWTEYTSIRNRFKLLVIISTLDNSIGDRLQADLDMGDACVVYKGRLQNDYKFPEVDARKGVWWHFKYCHRPSDNYAARVIIYTTPYRAPRLDGWGAGVCTTGPCIHATTVADMEPYEWRDNHYPNIRSMSIETACMASVISVIKNLLNTESPPSIELFRKSKSYAYALDGRIIKTYQHPEDPNFSQVFVDHGHLHKGISHPPSKLSGLLADLEDEKNDWSIRFDPERSAIECTTHQSN